MSGFSELIKNFDKTRDYIRDFFIYGFKVRNDFDRKSLRTYDDEKRPSSLVAASSFFMIEKMNAADNRQMAMRIPQMTGTETLPHMSIGIETR